MIWAGGGYFNDPPMVGELATMSRLRVLDDERATNLIDSVVADIARTILSSSWFQEITGFTNNGLS